MDREQEEAQFLGFFGIIKESVSVVLAWKKIFCQITLALVLPLSVIFLAHVLISEWLCGEIFDNENRLLNAEIGTSRYTNLSDIIGSEYTTLFIFTVVYYIFLLILSLLSTSAVVYTIACIYTRKDLTFKKVINVVPKVWKRLMVTFIWSSVIVCAYNFTAMLIFFIWIVMFRFMEVAIFVIFLIVYLAGLVYISIVWNLASVVSVLEDLYGIQAMIKSKSLIKGKRVVSGAMFLLLNLSFIGIQVALVVIGAEEGPLELSPGSKVGYEIICLLLLVVLILFGLVVQTIIYFVCKSYHHESIDKSALADHLEVYLGDYVPLKGMNMQLEQIQL